MNNKSLENPAENPRALALLFRWAIVWAQSNMDSDRRREKTRRAMPCSQRLGWAMSLATVHAQEFAAQNGQCPGGCSLEKRPEGRCALTCRPCVQIESQNAVTAWERAFNEH